MASKKWEKSRSHFRNSWWSDVGQAGVSDNSGLWYTRKWLLPRGSTGPQAARGLREGDVVGPPGPHQSAQLLTHSLNLTKSILFAYTKQNPQPWDVSWLPWRSAISFSLWPDRTQLFPTCCPLCTDRWISSDGSVKVLKPKPSCLLLQRIPLFPCWEARVHSWTLSSGVSCTASLALARQLCPACEVAGEDMETLRSILCVSVIME